MATKKNTKKPKDKTPYYWAVARITLGFTFFWAFLDKLFGLGFATCRNPETNVVVTMCEKAWLSGGSPTIGFLKFGTKGPFAEMFQGMAGNTFVDILFMAGLSLIGLSLIAGIGVRVATFTGSILMGLMYLASLFPANNPIIDEHIIYIIVLLGINSANKSQVLGLRSWWIKKDIVNQYPVLE